MKFVDALTGPQPAIAVPIVATTQKALLDQCQAVGESDAAVAEWRIDAWPEVPQDLAAQFVTRLHQAGKLVLLTIRTHREGGAFTGDVAAYAALYQRLLPLGADAIDIEASVPAVTRKQLVAAAHAQGVAVVASHHDFQQTPSFDAGQGILRAQSAWADVVKLAAMPQAPGDTLTLLALLAWAKLGLPQPAIVIGMGELGQLTRIATGAFAPGLTFATLGVASAPGQFTVATIKTLQEAQRD